MNSEQDKIALVKEALAEAQQTVRSYDVKAQIVGVGYIFALGIVFRLGNLLPKVEKDDILFVIAGWLIVIFPILLFGFVLYPTRKSVSSQNSDETPEDAKLEHILYFPAGRYATPKAYLEALDRADGLQERSDELLKVTRLRELKRKRFLRAAVCRWRGLCHAVYWTVVAQFGGRMSSGSSHATSLAYYPTSVTGHFATLPTCQTDGESTPEIGRCGEPTTTRL